MGRGREIAALSVPFAAGVAAGSFLFTRGLLPNASVILVLTSLLAVFLASGSRHLPFYSFLYFLLGLFCFSNRSNLLLPSFTDKLEDIASGWAGFLKTGIDRTGFRNQSSTALVRALLTGDRTLLDPVQSGHFRASGASHILALSGMHLGVIYIISKRVLSVLGNSFTARYIRSGCIVALSLVYTLAVGAGPSIIRAFLFILINEFCSISNSRQNDGKAKLPAALILHLSLHPESISSVSFQLSYLAICGLVFLSPPLQRLYPSDERKGPVKKIWDTCCTSISCQVFTAPLSWYYFHSFPKYFLLSNLISLPLAEGIIVLAVLLVLLGTMGIHPSLLTDLCEKMIEWLFRSMEIIAAM